MDLSVCIEDTLGEFTDKCTNRTKRRPQHDYFTEGSAWNSRKPVQTPAKNAPTNANATMPNTVRSARMSSATALKAVGP